MQYNVNNPSEYIESLELDWRKDKLQALRQMILEQEAAIDESINYKMLCYKLHNSVLFHLNAQKGYVSLYCGNTQIIDPNGVFLSGLNVGKGCIRFTKTKDIAKTGIRDFIAQAIKLNKKGIDISC
mgnify:CR=1 FL=1